ncbi:MAG TPA: beta-ketoacyl synthase N-terminal-like domain-containing protein [Gemmataceae bacterium]|nr:beta-ketoacyl synthase N-terminal-like domain-containing protein [Gemmataceae bacterium]
MLSPFLIVTPAHRLDAQLAIAGIRAGETGIFDLGSGEDQQPRGTAIRSLLGHVRESGRWGLRWDTLGDAEREPSCLKTILNDVQCPVLLLAGLGEKAREGALALGEALEPMRHLARWVLLEVCCMAEALAAQEAGVDAVVVKGHEAGGWVGEESTYLLLQRLHRRLSIPYWVQGGIGPDTAAAAFLSGATGVVLGEQLWLAAESPFDRAERRQWGQLDGSETVCIGDGSFHFRFFSRSGTKAVQEMQQALATGVAGPVWLRQCLVDVNRSGVDLGIAMGQEIAFARNLADKHTNVAGILEAFRRQVRANLDTARQGRALAPDGPLAQTHGTRYPILQGPMTRVSDTAAFAHAVAENGALPFLALALMNGPEVSQLLSETSRHMAERPWGVGVLGFVPAELRKAQIAEVCKVRPSHAIIAGGRPSQARQLEEHGISTYLHVPSPGLLESFIREGARKFILEGRECGGHVGPRSSFALWQSAIDVLLAAESDQPEEFHIIFAGGIHDRLSSAMAAALAAPLSARGMKIGVLMGTAYLFTREAVDTGAILPEFQRLARTCQETILLESSLGHATRCVNTPFAEEFNRIRGEMIRTGKSSDEIREQLEMLNVGRLRIASKGLARPSDPRRPGTRAELVPVSEEVQRQQGLYMIGQVAALRQQVLTMADLHADVAEGNLDVLDQAATRPLPWQQPGDKVKVKSIEVAIIGMACMLPRAKDVRSYWQNICNCIDAIDEVPPDRWRIEDFYCEDRLARDRVYSKWGGFLEKVFFDPVKWHIPPASLTHIEPMQLLSLEVAAQAMVDAGYNRRDFPRERAGVLFAVPGSHELGSAYSFRTMMRHYLPKVENLAPEARERLYASLEGHLPEWTEDSFPGLLGNVVAGRIARELDFHGPNFTVDAACAASLAALFTAVEQLRSGTADFMLVGAADGTNNPFGYMSFAKTHALSPRGRSRSFDDTGDGIALGEGIGCIVLKRLADAERDGDKIYAVIKGVGASSDGKNRSLTAPYPPGQIRAITRAYEDAQISPATVSLIEAHGTGTAVGDSAELTTLTQVFAPHAPERQSVGVGSVKSMIGHTKTLAGLASVIKAALALKHHVLPATIGIDKPNSRVDFSTSPLYLNTETRPWLEENGKHPRRAGVSSFGFGGTNFHVVLEEYTGDYLPASRIDWSPRSAEVIVFRRASRDEMARHLDELHRQLLATPTDNLAGLSAALFTDESSRSADNSTCRLAIVAESVEDLRQKIQKALALLPHKADIRESNGIYYSEAPPLQQAEVGFLYPGQGSQTVNMLRDLVIGSAWSHDLFRHANRLLAEFLPRPLTQLLFPPPVFTAAERERQQAELKETRVAQPALGLVELFATELLERFAIRPARVAGHSYGEHVALHVAGCLSREDLLRVSAQRGQVCADVARSCPGAMASVRADAETTAAVLKELNISAQLANLNAPDQTVIAGTVEVIEQAVEQLPKVGIRALRIPVSAAFHTSLLSGAAEVMAIRLAAISFEKPTLPVYSNTTGERHIEQPEVIRRLLTQHLTQPVLFEKQVRRMHADGVRLFLEVGPGAVLTSLVPRILEDRSVIALALDAPGRAGWTQLGHLLARLAVLGLPIRLEAWFEGRDLPSSTVTQLLARERAENTPKPTDWVLSPNKAEPVTPLPNSLANGRSQLRGRNDQPADTGHSPTPSLSPQPRQPVSSTVDLTSFPIPINNGHAQKTFNATSKQERTSRAMCSTNNNHAGNGHVPLMIHPSNNLFEQLQATMRVVFAGQQAVLERYLVTQERILRDCMRGAAADASVMPPIAHLPISSVPEEPISAPAPAVEADSTVLVAPPSSPVSRVIPARTGTRSPIAVDGPPTSPRHRVEGGGSDSPSTPHAPPAARNDGPPITEQFRQDLLAVVSMRTGYPIDALDETLALESALGIDSIKTVEIFSKLKAYHLYFRAEGQEEEELLAEFSKFKTLRDIIASYDNRRKAHLAAQGSNGTGQQATEGVKGSPKTSGGVERYSVAVMPAPLEVNGAKKNPLTAALSS